MKWYLVFILFTAEAPRSGHALLTGAVVQTTATWLRRGYKVLDLAKLSCRRTVSTSWNIKKIENHFLLLEKLNIFKMEIFNNILTPVQLTMSNLNLIHSASNCSWSSGKKCFPRREICLDPCWGKSAWSFLNNKNHSN